jgi:hypothetical protein
VKSKHKTLKTIADLTSDPQNANRGTKRGLGLLDNSLRQYGAGRSILADKNGVVMAGNKTLERAADIGLPVRVVESDGTELIVVQRTDLDIDEPDGRLMAYNDNRVAQVDLDWNPDQLLADVKKGIDLSGLFGKDLDAIIKQAKGSGHNDSELPDAPPGRVKAGEVWRCGEHIVVCGDSTDQTLVRSVVGGQTVRMVWADPPYGIEAAGSFMGGYSKRFEDIVGDDSTDTAGRSIDACRALFPEAVQIWWGANHYSNLLPTAECWLVWDKQVPEGVSFADAELAWCSSKSPVRIFRHAWSGWNKGEEQGTKKAHPTQKPIALARWAFESYGSVGDVIFDPFLGSGCSILGTMGTGRRIIGFELVPHYCDVTLARWAATTGLEPELQSCNT